MIKILLTLIFLFSTNVFAQSKEPWRKSEPVSDEKPKTIENVGIDEKLGDKIDLGLSFKDETGKQVFLKDYFDGKRPVILSLVYFECPMLCNLHLNGVTEVFKKSQWKLGKEFDMVVVSIDPKETPELAAKKKANYLKEYDHEGAENGWHFLTADQKTITALAGQVGFKYKWDEETKQWAHVSAMYVLTPEGRLSRYLYGIHFTPKDLKLSLLEASNNKIGTVIDHLMLFCFQYDPNRRTYAFVAFKIMKYGGALFALLLAAILVPQWIKFRREGEST